MGALGLVLQGREPWVGGISDPQRCQRGRDGLSWEQGESLASGGGRLQAVWLQGCFPGSEPSSPQLCLSEHRKIPGGRRAVAAF